MIAASAYRAVDRAVPAEVARELNRIVNAPPTSIHPDERGAYLSAILDDLRPAADAPWTRWPDDLHLLALTATKTLGRNPVGSDALLSDAALSTVLFHSALPLDAAAAPAAPPPPAPAPLAAPALEALRVLANVCVLHAAGRRKLGALGGGKAVARALKEDASAGSAERLFLLGRIGFLVTVDGGRPVRDMVDEDVVDCMVSHLDTLESVPANFNALSELLKLTNNILRFAPQDKSTATSEEPWDERLDSLLPPLVALAHEIPFADLSPPLTHVLHALLPIPLNAINEAAWAFVPVPPAAPARRSSTSTSSAPPSPPSVSRPVKALISKISQMGSPSSPRRSAETPRKSSDGLAPPSTSPRRGSSDSLALPDDAGAGAGGARTLAVPRPPSPSRSSPRSSRSPSSPAGARARPARSTRPDPSALPARVLAVLEDWLATHLPFPRGADDAPPAAAIDEALPPVLLLLTKLAGSKDMRAYMKARLLPADLDRSAEAGPLERRRGLLGDLLRLLGSSHAACRDTTGEFLWALCGEDATEVSHEIGYGNAAGLLFRKGLSGPPPPRIDELPDTDADGEAPAAPGPADVNPITAIREADAAPGAAHGMTPAEAEREAERLFVLFDRLERNPVISAQAGDGQGRQGIRELMRAKVEAGEGEAWDRQDEAREREAGEREEREDEAQAAREVAELRKRQGRA